VVNAYWQAAIPNENGSVSKGTFKEDPVRFFIGLPLEFIPHFDAGRE
jgi:hypothetical protein